MKLGNIHNVYNRTIAKNLLLICRWISYYIDFSRMIMTAIGHLCMNIGQKAALAVVTVTVSALATCFCKTIEQI